ncbi:MAG: aminomethyl-transferring glycine dehydrogenase subunit GcvPB [Caldisericaceae bacterium]
MKLIYEESIEQRKGYSLPEGPMSDIALSSFLPDYALSKDRKLLPEVSEVDVVRHFANLAKMNYGLDSGFYPLGSCTMKYNPKINESLASIDRFTGAHPFADEQYIQGSLQVIYELEQLLKEITGMERFTLSPAAGAHGELTGVLIIRKYFEDSGKPRHKMIVPDSAHGTNPASSSMAGFKVIEVKSNINGTVDVNDLDKLMDDDTAGIMLTNPNTAGIFEEDIVQIAEIVHKKGGLLYYDGANLNALLAIVRPGDVGFDVVHLNLHKTFSTPHGSGGPGVGAVGVKKNLAEFLPTPLVCKCNDYYAFEEPKKTIGKVRAFYGNFSVLVKAYAWILSMGKENIREVAEMSVINANYIMAKLKKYFRPAYDKFCMHECVLTGRDYKQYQVKTLDIAKRIMDYGFHPPTIYFPHFEPFAEETIMIEPTESESKETLDAFIDAMISISSEAKTNPDLLREAPHSTPVRRCDETKAALKPILTYED